MNSILLHIKYTLSKFSFNNKKKLHKKLKESFGTYKNDSFDFNAIDTYFRNKDHTKAYHILSDKTCNDLDFDDLFRLIDRTNSKVGQQYLYNTLRTVSIDEKQTLTNEQLIAKLTNDAELRVSIQEKLEKLNTRDSYSITRLFQDAHLTPPKWLFITKILSFASLVVLMLSFFNPFFYIVFMGIFCINLLLHMWNKNNLLQYVNSIPLLLKLNNTAAHLHAIPSLKQLNPQLSNSIKIINEVKTRMSFFNFGTKANGEFEILAWYTFEMIKIAFILEPILLFGILKRLDTKRKEIESVFTFVGHIDMLISIASLRNGTPLYCTPTITSTNKIIATEIKHPLIFDCITNTISITDKSILLTGSNMSGKTSFIRAIGLNIITGLTINTCFAKAMTFPLLRVFSAIRISDDITNDKSYYFEEVLTIKEMLTESATKKNNLFLLDEIFKGTNTIERISAGKAVLSKLTKNNNIVIVSTHDIELTDLLSKTYDLYHFSEVLKNKTVTFDYKLKQGKLKNRNAIRILEINGYPKEVVSEALELSKKLDRTYASAKK